MKRLLLIITIGFSMIHLADAQKYYEEESDSLDFKDRIYLGGNFSFNIFGNFKYVDVSPLVGYMFNPRFSAGLGISYQYLSREFIAFPSGNRFTVSSSVYGGRTFARYNVSESYFAYTEFESLRVEFGVGEVNGSVSTLREWVPGFFIGGGTFQPIFANGGINIMILYNVLHDEIRSPYNSAWVVRGGFTF